MKLSEIRKRFLDYFARHSHTVVPSSSLVPENDPTLLFTNAGMVQFKDVFLGAELAPYRRATSSQRCMRAGGKHNDLEHVGYTSRHHTFFEMLGNFSFGDYFKREAIHFAWQFLRKELHLPQEKLWITVFEDDHEAAAIWRDEVGVPKERIVFCGEKDNFWQMGDEGPCGPCSEIYYDHGPEIAGGPPGSPDADGDRFVEIWNLVFMQYNRDAKGHLSPLPQPSVDTGMGLERITAVMQGVHNNYDIDLFKALIAAAAKATGASNLADHSLRVIADHSRACTFLVADGVLPSNEGRGHVLRRIIRRAVRHGYRLGKKEPFFYTLADAVVQLMGDAYPYLFEQVGPIQAILRSEEEKFGETLTHGLVLLDAAMRQGDGILDGETVFKLYDTYGFPLDLTADIAREAGVIVDFGGFEEAMARQRQRARAAHHFKIEGSFAIEGTETLFVGFDIAECDAMILAIYHEGSEVNAIDEGDEAVIVLDRTPFYAEGGGQVGDAGEFLSNQGIFIVEDTQKLRAGIFGHKGRLQMGRLSVGDTILAKIDNERRQNLAAHHSATHLLHAALRKILGPHVAQKGSLVEPERLRFDFSHHKPLTEEEWFEVENLVNAEIRKMERVTPRLMQYEEAIAQGALAFFGEKYGSEVRVVRIGDFSTELCGGTHVHNTGEIGLFKIISETSVASGVRRIEAMTGQNALRTIQKQQRDILHLARRLKTMPESLDAKVEEVLSDLQQKEKLSLSLKAKLARFEALALLENARTIAGVPMVFGLIEEADAKSLRLALDEIKSRSASVVAVLASQSDGFVSVIAGVSKDIAPKLPATSIIAFFCEHTGIKGGGRPDMAQAGGARLEDFQKALEKLPQWLETRLTAC